MNKAQEYLKARNKNIFEFEDSTATVELAAAALGVLPARIAKTLSFLLKDGTCVLVVAAGDAKIDNAKFKQIFGCKAKMLTPQQVIDFTGHAIGGVCPFAIENDAVKTYLDQSLQRFDTVFPAAGSAHSAVELSVAELYELGNAQAIVDVCKLPEN